MPGATKETTVRDLLKRIKLIYRGNPDYGRATINLINLLYKMDPQTTRVQALADKHIDPLLMAVQALIAVLDEHPWPVMIAVYSLVLGNFSADGAIYFLKESFESFGNPSSAFVAEGCWKAAYSQQAGLPKD